MEARAAIKYAKISAHKVRPVLDQVRDLSGEEALGVLSASSKKAARYLEKTIQSAVANLKAKGKVADASIVIKKIFADEGPLFPRVKYQPRARGSADRIRSRTCHITVVVEGQERSRTRRRVNKDSPSREDDQRRQTDGSES